MGNLSSKKVIITSLIVDISDIALNGIIAFVTGSSVMLAEALQGLSDLLTVIFLYIGIKRSSKKPNANFNFGYGRELYFWVLCSAIAMLVLTAGLSFHSGYQKYMNPEPLERTFWAYFVLVVGIITNSYALSVSLHKIKSTPTKASIIKSFVQSRLIEIKTTFITDLMGTISAASGLIAIVLYGLTGDARYDGAGAMLIAIAIAFFAIFLIKESKEMIIGRGVTSKEREEIKQIVKSHPMVKEVNNISTVHFGSEELYVSLNIEINKNLMTEEITRGTDEIEASIKKHNPLVDKVQTEIDG